MAFEFPLLQVTDSLSMEQTGKLIIEDEKRVAVIIAKILEKDWSILSSHNVNMDQYGII